MGSQKDVGLIAGYLRSGGLSGETVCFLLGLGSLDDLPVPSVRSKSNDMLVTRTRNAFHALAGAGALTPVEAVVLLHRKGATGRVLPLREIGVQLGVGRERVRQIEAKAQEKLRRQRGGSEGLAIVLATGQGRQLIEVLEPMIARRRKTNQANRTDGTNTDGTNHTTPETTKARMTPLQLLQGVARARAQRELHVKNGGHQRRA